MQKNKVIVGHMLQSKEILLLKTFSLVLLSLLACYIEPARGLYQKPAFSIVNPGLDGYPSKWTASNVIRYLGTSVFTFYSNETSVDSTFFVNVTVQNVTALRGWGIGIIYDSGSLANGSVWLPSDHVFSGAENVGNKIIPFGPAVDNFNATHKILKYGVTYVMNNTWTFNGSGTLCQVQFKIVTPYSAESYLSWDLEWTDVYYWPSGSEKPLVEVAHFKYSSETEKEDLLFMWILVTSVVAVVVFASLVYFFGLRKKRKK